MTGYPWASCSSCWPARATSIRCQPPTQCPRPARPAPCLLPPSCCWAWQPCWVRAPPQPAPASSAAAGAPLLHSTGQCHGRGGRGGLHAGCTGQWMAEQRVATPRLVPRRHCRPRGAQEDPAAGPGGHSRALHELRWGLQCCCRHAGSCTLPLQFTPPRAHTRLRSHAGLNMQTACAAEIDAGSEVRGAGGRCSTHTRCRFDGAAWRAGTCACDAPHAPPPQAFGVSDPAAADIGAIARERQGEIQAYLASAPPPNPACCTAANEFNEQVGKRHSSCPLLMHSAHFSPHPPPARALTLVRMFCPRSCAAATPACCRWCLGSRAVPPTCTTRVSGVGHRGGCSFCISTLPRPWHSRP